MLSIDSDREDAYCRAVHFAYMSPKYMVYSKIMHTGLQIGLQWKFAKCNQVHVYDIIMVTGIVYYI